MMDGIIVINKEEGYTSHDVVSCLRGILHIRRIGHTGTLDPMATGVLPAAVGRGTSLAGMLTEKKKTYRTRMHLGITTDTQDRTGSVISEKPVGCTESQILDAVRSFEGEQMQVPPMYSALKVNGKKLYELAREGKTVERKARPVTFYEIRVTDISLPFIEMTVQCSKGTYIRTLCHDIGESLGCGAMMESLQRTASGSFTLENAFTLEEVRNAVEAGRLEDIIIPVEEVLNEYPSIKAVPGADLLLRNGNPVGDHLIQVSDGPLPEGDVRMYLSDGTFIGLYSHDSSRHRYKALKMFL